MKKTPFTKEEIFDDLKNRGYIEDHTLSPEFKTADKSFQFSIDPRFSDINDEEKL